ncbi:MAG TPA: EamA family transporter [Alphaproteobacteria bacterium]|nr:EamA family transporter [Alphaproteobacteria bacterium]
MTRKTKGVMLGVVGTCAYGTNPLFALPLYKLGFGVNSVLFYRYLLALILYGLWVTAVKKHSLKVSAKQALFLIPLGVVFSMSSLTLFMSYNYIGAGIASTILFIYPIMVAIIMSVFFKEKLSLRTVGAIVLTTAGIAMFYEGKDGETLNMYGFFLVMMSALSYALYMVALKKTPALRHIPYTTLTFYVMLFGISVFAFNLAAGVERIARPDTPFVWGCLLGVALFPTIVSLETMTITIKLIGPTLSAILGALEPVTAVVISVLLFGEAMTLKIAAGIVLILSAVFLIVWKSKKKTKPNA